MTKKGEIEKGNKERIEKKKRRKKETSNRRFRVGEETRTPDLRSHNPTL